MAPEAEEKPSFASEEEINSFGKHLYRSKRILALCSAGLSVASGIPTFRGVGSMGIRRGHRASTLSSVEAFKTNPGLVWQYFADRRAEPNRAHRALAALAKKRKGFVCLTQDIDGLSERAKHPRDRLYQLHGSLFDIKCTNGSCDYVEKDNRKEPLSPALTTNIDFSRIAEKTYATLKLPSDATPHPNKSPEPKPRYEPRPKPLQEIIDGIAPTITPEMRVEVIPESLLPHCLTCSSLLRPAIVWFGEFLSRSQLDKITAWINEEKKLDLMLVIGTTAEVYPAARFVQIALEKGARIAFVNLDGKHTGDAVVRNKDWVFVGNAEGILSILFEGTLEN